LEHFFIRPFEEKDVAFAYKLDKIEQWGDTRNDIERMFSYEPAGCFVAEINGKPVGHVFSISYGHLGWIGLLIVKAEHRGKGIGTLLTKRAINYLLNKGVKTIRLEAVSKIVNLYQKLGFVDEYYSLRFKGVSNGKTAISLSSQITSLKREEITELAKFDAEHFGANRIKVLKRLYCTYSKFCFVSHLDSKIVGYIMSRKKETGYRIGPWICNPENPQVARELLMKCIAAIGQNVILYVGVPAVNKAAIEILHDFNLKQYSKSIRMYLGKKLETEQANGIFAIGGPEKG